jgi:tRNA(His) 5'-end guanylyltransferase
MDEKLLTKEEYTEKLNSIVKPMVEFAMSTEKFNRTGCYSEEFVKIGDKEVTLVVVDSSWVILPQSIWSDYLKYRQLYNDTQRVNEMCKKETKVRRKFFGLF